MRNFQNDYLHLMLDDLTKQERLNQTTSFLNSIQTNGENMFAMVN